MMYVGMIVLYLKTASGSWVANLPEPMQSAGIYCTQEYGSPNVLDGNVPHATVGYNSILAKEKNSTEFARHWQNDVMERLNDV
jgi:hypothetical protein